MTHRNRYATLPLRTGAGTLYTCWSIRESAWTVLGSFPSETKARQFVKNCYHTDRTAFTDEQMYAMVAARLTRKGLRAVADPARGLLFISANGVFYVADTADETWALDVYPNYETYRNGARPMLRWFTFVSSVCTNTVVVANALAAFLRDRSGQACPVCLAVQDCAADCTYRDIRMGR